MAECLPLVDVSALWLPGLLFVSPLFPLVPGLVGGGIVAWVCAGGWYRNGVEIAAMAATTIAASPSCRLLSGTNGIKSCLFLGLHC